jgi:cell division protein ZapA (FtsZ GTPase activity inhibitor)
MDDKKHKMVFKLSGEQITFLVDKADEPYFSDARSLLNQRMSELSQKYAAFTHTKQLIASLAIEALVDGLKVNDKYQRLKTEVDNRLNTLHNKFEN